MIFVGSEPSVLLVRGYWSGMRAVYWARNQAHLWNEMYEEALVYTLPREFVVIGDLKRVSGVFKSQKSADSGDIKDLNRRQAFTNSSVVTSSHKISFSFQFPKHRVFFR